MDTNTQEEKRKLTSEYYINTTKQDKELLYLQRRWQILDSTKQIRFQLSIVLGALLLGVTGFIFSQKLNNNLLYGIGTSLFVLIFTLCGLVLLGTVHRQYLYSCNEIDYVYKQLDMTGSPFDYGDLYNKHNPAEKGQYIWIWSYIFILMIGLSCMLCLLISCCVQPKI